MVRQRDRKKLSENERVNKRRHKVVTWMLMDYKDDAGRSYSDAEIAKKLGVSLSVMLNDKRVIRRQYDNLKWLPAPQLELAEMLQQAAGRVNLTADQIEELCGEILRCYELSDGDPALRKELLAAYIAKLAVPDKILAIAKFMQPQQQPGLPQGSQFVNVQGDMHQATNQQILTHARMMQMLEERNPEIGSGRGEDDSNFMNGVTEEEIGIAAGALRDVVDEDNESE